MQDFRFANPEFASLILLLPLVYFLLERFQQGAWEKLLRFVDEENLRLLLRGRTSIGARSKQIAFWLGMVCLILALARPQANPTVEERNSTGLDIYTLLDVSRSMDAEDVAPSRLKKAKRTILALASKLSGDRIGIVAYANSAVLVTPLTSDYSVLESFLQNIDTSLIPSQGTNLGAALQVANEAMERGSLAAGADAQHSNIFLVMSDGEDFGDSDLAIADKIHKTGSKIFAIAFGTEKGVPIPVRDEKGELRGYKKDREGNPVVTAVKPAVLQEVAKRGGGQFYFSTVEASEVQDILARVESMQQGSQQSTKITVYEEYFWAFLAVGLLALLYSFISLRSFFKTSVKSAPLALAFFFALSGKAQANPLSFLWSKERKASEQSRALAGENKYAEAVDALKALQAENPDSPELNYNIGTYLIQDKKAEMGREQLNRLRSADGSLREMALFNSAGSYAQDGKKEEARADYAELIGLLSRQRALSKEETQLLDLAKKNVARLADPNQAPQPKQQQNRQDQNQGGGGDKKENKPNGGGGGGDNKDKNDQQKDDKKDQSGKDDKNKDKDGKNQDKDKEKDKQGDQDKNKDSENGDDQKKKEDQKDGQQKQDQGQQRPTHGKQPFQERDNMGEEDAKRILGTLQERESTLQKKFLKNRTKGGKVNVDDATKDW